MSIYTTQSGVGDLGLVSIFNPSHSGVGHLRPACGHVHDAIESGVGTCIRYCSQWGRPVNMSIYTT